MHYASVMERRQRTVIGLFLLSSFLLFCSSLEAKKKPPARPVNINTATSEELQQVPGIGPATAGKILQMRKSYGAFKSVDDLLAIRGLGAKRLEKMRKYLTVGKTPKAPQLSPPGSQKPESPPCAKPATSPRVAPSQPHQRNRTLALADRKPLSTALRRVEK
jgi:competence ComEA-like helix-hairpin-helix protein